MFDYMGWTCNTSGKFTNIYIYIYMDLQYFGQIVSVTHVMIIKFKNNIIIYLLTGTGYYTPLKLHRWGEWARHG